MVKYKQHILMHAIIIVWGFTGILGKLIFLPPEILVWYRIIIATVGLLFLLPILKIPLRLKRKKDILPLALVGVITALHWITFFKAIALSTASLGILCLSTTALHVAWLDPIVMKRRFSWVELFFGLLVVYGIYFVSSDFNALEYEALAYGLTAGLLAACFSVFNAKLVQTISSSQITFYEMLTGMIFLTIVLFFTNNLNAESLQITTSDFWWLMFLGLICTSVAFVLIIDIVKKLGAFTVSLSINMEPVYTIILAILILGENQLLNNKFYIGAVIILLVVIANTFVRSKFKNNKKPPDLTATKQVSIDVN